MICPYWIPFEIGDDVGFCEATSSYFHSGKICFQSKAFASDECSVRELIEKAWRKRNESQRIS